MHVHTHIHSLTLLTTHSTHSIHSLTHSIHSLTHSLVTCAQTDMRTHAQTHLLYNFMHVLDHRRNIVF